MTLWLLILGAALTLASFTLLPRWVGNRAGERAEAALPEGTDWQERLATYKWAYDQGFGNAVAYAFWTYFALMQVPVVLGLGYLVYLGVRWVA